MDFVNKTREIIAESQEKYDIKTWCWLFSGGDDSLAVGKVSHQILLEQGKKIDFAIFCDTGTCIPETKGFVIQTCREMDIPLIIGTTTEKDSYENYVLRFGFPSQNQRQHQVMYRMLKSHSLSRAISSIRQRRRNYHIGLLTGARIDESVRRMSTAKNTMEKRGADIWVNAINHWSKNNIRTYFSENNIDRSVVAKTIGRSGECNCGVYGSPQELEEIRVVSPTFYAYMKDLEDRVLERGHCWRWGESIPSDFFEVASGQTQLEGMQASHYTQNMFMCSTCTNNMAYKTEITPAKAKAIEELKILQSVCNNDKDVLTIGMLLNVEKQLLTNDKKIEKMMKIISNNA